MDETLEATVRRLTGESDLVRSVASVRQDGGLALAIRRIPLRQLFKAEIAQLEALGNTAEDWFRVKVADGFNPRRVRNCEFHGDVVLGEFKRRVHIDDRTVVLAGVSNSTLVDCVVGTNAVIRDVRLLANYVVAADAIVVDCGRVTCTASTTFGNGTSVPIALEGGGREVEVFAEMDITLATKATRPGRRRAELEDYRRAVAKYCDRVTSDKGIIETGACVWGVRRLEDSFVGPGARVDGATCVYRTTLLSTTDAPVVVESGALVADSLVQWGCRITGMAVVERSVLIEQARVERHGKLRDSVIGPNTEIAAGEVSSCLLGPFVGCHHQSLLISTLWPAGRGNVGYGANVGSNHTSRVPDQELWAGEGLFFGLGVNVKFPCNFSRAPYTVIACGTNIQAQEVTFPFSLITPSKEHFPGVPAAFNRIIPAWVLRENIYALKRNEAKFRARNRAKRHQFDFSVFRCETMECMRQAARRLAGIQETKPFYTERDIEGLGKNVMKESDRVEAIEAYWFYMCYYALLGLRQQLRDAITAGRGDTGRLLATASTQEEWEYQRRILVQEFGVEDTGEALSLLPSMAMQVARNCELAREKDDNRGVRIIDDYAEVHPAADRDRVVRQTWEEWDRLRDEAEESLLRNPVRAGNCMYISTQPAHTNSPASLPR